MARGKKIRQETPNSPAPSMRAASTSSPGILAK
jgi:hypothetical protein